MRVIGVVRCIHAKKISVSAAVKHGASVDKHETSERAVAVKGDKRVRACGGGDGEGGGGVRIQEDQVWGRNEKLCAHAITFRFRGTHKPTTRHDTRLGCASRDA